MKEVVMNLGLVLIVMGWIGVLLLVIWAFLGSRKSAVSSRESQANLGVD